MKHSKLIEKAMDYVSKATGRDFQWAEEYAEPGYSCEHGIVFANWNDKDGQTFLKRLGNVLEKLGIECEWEDEWSTCGECGKAVRTRPDCYHWTSYYRIVNDCELLCLDCIKEDAQGYLESIEDNPRQACPPEIKPEEHGYTQYNGKFETGFNPGMNADPKKLLAQMQSEGLRHIVFQIEEQSQFYVTWKAFHKAD